MTEKSIAEQLTEADFNELDREALTRSLRILMATDRKDQLEYVMARDGWYFAASFASSVLQGEVLNLSPWQHAPSDIEPEYIDRMIAAGPDEMRFNNRDYGGAKLLKRMLAAGLSQFEPDPLAAINAKRK